MEETSNTWQQVLCGLIRFIKALIDQPQGRPRKPLSRTVLADDGKARSAMTILRTLKGSGIAYEEVLKYLATRTGN